MSATAVAAAGGRGGLAVRAGSEGAAVPGAGVRDVGCAADPARRRGVPFDPHRRPAGPRVAGMARQLHVLDRARAGAGGVRGHAEARKGLLVRFAEAAAAFLIVSLALYVGLFLGRFSIFSWLHEPRPDIGVWLTTKFFFVRNGLIYVALAWLSWRFVRHDMAPDLEELADGRPAERLAGRDKIAREAAILIVGYAFGYSLLAFDLMMSLAHKWVSNLFGAFYFMGSFLAALMALAVIAILLRRAMRLGDLISLRQLHDLGKLCFGFTVFWGYLMWAQFLVIWYGNLPEETYFIFYRLIGPWKPVGVAVFFLVLVIPFVGLLGAKPKKSPPILLAFAVTSLVGIWLERYLEIVPSINGGAGPALGLPEVGVSLLFGGLYLLAIGWFAARFPMISPRLAADTLEREQH